MEFKLKRKLQDLPIAQKIALPFSLMIIAIAVFINLYFPGRREYQAKLDLKGKIEFISRVCAHSVSQSLAVNDEREVQQALSAFDGVPDLLYLVVADNEQNIAGALRRQNAYRYDFIATEPMFNHGIKAVKIRYSIEVGGKKLGYVYAGLATVGLLEDLANIRAAISILSGIIILLGVGVIIFTSQLVTKPLRTIAETAGFVSGGNLSRRAPIYYNDEVGELALAFNRMVEKLETAHTQFSELNKTLETRIIERTKSLQDEINEHRQTEEALRKSQQQLLREQKIFIGGPTVVYRLNVSDGYLLEYISANVEQFGFAAEELILNKSSIASLLQPADAERFKRETQAALFNQSPHFESTFTLLNSSGEQRYVYNFSKHVVDAANQLTHIDGYLIDITAGKHAEQALVESELRFKTIFETAGVGIATVDLNGNFIEANNAFIELTGFSLPELRQRSFMSISHPDDLQKEMDRFNTGLQLFSEPSPFRSEKRFIHKSGRIVWGRLTSTFVRSTDGVPLFGVGMVEDITVKRQAEALVIQQNLLLNGLAESLRILLTTEEYSAALQQTLARLGLSTKTDRVILYENVFTAENAVIGKSRFEWRKNFEIPSPPDSFLYEINFSRFLPKWLEAFLLKESVSGALEYFPESERVHFTRDRVKSIYMAPLFTGDTFWGVLRFDDCLTDGDWNEGKRSFIHTAASSLSAHISREIARLQLISAKEKALESDQLKSALFSNMSHEFRTPMNGILGYAEILSELHLEGEKKAMALSIKGSALRLMRTISSVLDLAQLESGGVQFTPKPTDAGLILRELVERYMPEAEEKQIELTLSIKEGGIHAMADAELLEKALDHIINNAIRFTNLGSVALSAEVQPHGKYEALVIKIRDTGIGISPELQNMVFKEFRQASEGMGRGYEGSGLGLAIAKRIITVFRGEINLISEPGMGSLFTVTLPAVSFGSFHDGQTTPEAPVPAPANDSGQKFRALIIEDNPANADITKLFIREHFDSTIALSGQDGLAKCHEHLFDVVLMDINLGTDIDGVQTFHLIRQIKGYEHVPVVALTGYAMAGDKEYFLDAGFSAYLAKPFEKKRINALLDEIAKKHFQHKGELK